MHGKISKVSHYGKGLFDNLPQSFQVTRYHSLVLCRREKNQDFRSTDGQTIKSLWPLAMKKKGCMEFSSIPKASQLNMAMRCCASL